MLEKMSLLITLWNLPITFESRHEIWNGFLEMKLSSHTQLFLFESFLKKVTLLCLHAVWNSICNTISAFYMSHMVCLTSYHWTCIKSLTSPSYILKIKILLKPNMVYIVWHNLYGVFYMVYCIRCKEYCIWSMTCSGHYICIEHVIRSEYY